MVKALWECPAFQCTLSSLLSLYLTDSVGTLGTDLLNMSTVTPLRKSHDAPGVRPVAIPTVLRKLVAKAAVAHWREPLRKQASVHQYSALTPDGAAKCAKHARTLLTQAPGTVLIRTDVKNAFNSHDRGAVTQALHQVDPALASLQLPWLKRSSQALLRDETGNNHCIATNLGLPQGDPLSSLAFTAVLGPLLVRLREESPAEPVAFADDIMLIVNKAAAADSLALWARLLDTVGLSMSQDKLLIWDPAPDPLFQRSIGETFLAARVTHEGLTVCGLPLEHHGRHEDPYYLALGEARYVAEFLGQALVDFRRRLTVLTAFLGAASPQSPAAHAAFHILRTNLAPRYVHIFRFLPLRLTLPFARQLDTELRTWVEAALDLRLGTPQCHSILTTPPKWGGLGITTFEVDALPHCCSGHIALPDAREPTSNATEADSILMPQEELHRLLRKDPLGCVSHLLPHRRARALRQETLQALAVAVVDLCPWLQIPPITAEASRQGITAAFAYRVAMSWWTAQGPFLLPQACLRHRIGVHCLAALLPPGRQCQYIQRIHGTPCCALLGPQGHRIFSCGQGTRQHKHDKMRDAWSDLLRQAGWHPNPEQVVRTGPDTTHRADIVATSPGGHAYALDLHFTAPLSDRDPPGDHLQRAAMAKAARYHTCPGGSLPGGTLCYPVVYAATRPFLHDRGLTLLFWIMRDLAAKTESASTARWGYHLAAVTSSATAALGHAYAIASWRHFLACSGN